MLVLTGVKIMNREHVTREFYIMGQNYDKK